jgi:hypothetical protein
MNKLVSDKINGYGSILRFITPILIVTVGYFITSGIDDLKCKIGLMDTHFTNHLQHHQDLEVGYERRLTKIETELNHKK